MLWVTNYHHHCLNTYTKTEVYDLLTDINLTGSENINITNNEVSLTYRLRINSEPFLNPRVNGYFEIYAAPNGISSLQHKSDCSQPIAILNSLGESVELFCGFGIPNLYNRNETANLKTNLNLVDYYTKSQVDSLISNINLVGYYTKAEIDTVLYTKYPSLTFLINNLYSKTEIDSSLSGYTTSAQLHIDFYSKVKANIISDTYTTATQLYDDFHNQIYIDNMFLTSTQTETLYYNKTDTDNSLANKVSNIGDISLPGMLDIGTSGFINSRIRCNAELKWLYWVC